MVKKPHANAGDIRNVNVTPGGEKHLEEVIATHIFLLEDTLDRRGWQATVPRVTER